MNLDQPWNIVFLLGFVAYLGIRHRFAQRTKDNAVAASQRDRLEVTLLVLVFAGSLFAPIVYLLTPVLAFADYRLPALAPWFGAPIMAASLWLFWRSHVDLGRNWSVTLETFEEHQLVTGGVYRTVRHPMYAAIWLFGLAQALLLQNWLAGWAALITFAPLYFIRAPREERMMREAFGDAYEHYRQRTGRVFPKLG